MRFMLMSLIPHAEREDAPASELAGSTHRRLREITAIAVLAEELGLDAFGVGERHDAPYLSSAPPVILAHLAALTTRIQLFTAATTLAFHDPVRAFEDYSTLDHLSDGRLQLIVGNGLGTAGQRLFGLDPALQADRTTASYELFRELWHHDRVTTDDALRPALTDVQVRPRPLQAAVPVWHAGLSSRASAERAASYGEPLVSGNLFAAIEEAARHVALYREAWASFGHDPAAAQVGVGVAGVHVTPRSQDARTQFEPVFESQQQMLRSIGREPSYASYQDYLTRSTALVGSPAEVREKLALLTERFGHQLTYHHADAPGLEPSAWRASIELYAAEVVAPLQPPSQPAPAVGALSQA